VPIYKEVNRAFFKKWTPEIAYVLGFFAADGTMIVNKRGAHFIEFDVTDKEILTKIRKTLNSNHKISVRDRRSKRNTRLKLGYRLQIGSKEIFTDLSYLGFTPNKSRNIKLPKIPEKFTGDFVRGYFDGDGCVYFRKHKVKGRKNKRWVFPTRITCGSYNFLDSLHKLLSSYLSGGFITAKKGGWELVYSHRDSLALYKLMYNTNCHSLYLERKHKLFSKAINTLYDIKLRS
jgi:intein-encoded DNA endonuclease-like protein